MVSDIHNVFFVFVEPILEAWVVNALRVAREQVDDHVHLPQGRT